METAHHVIAPMTISETELVCVSVICTVGKQVRVNICNRT